MVTQGNKGRKSNYFDQKFCASVSRNGLMGQEYMASQNQYFFCFE